MQMTIYKINSKVLLYNTGNYIQYPVINDNGKEYEFIYINWIILLYIRNTTLYINYPSIKNVLN